MPTLTAFCIFLYFGLVRNLADFTDWVDDLIKYVAVDSDFKQLKLMTRLDENEYFENPVIDELFVKVMQNVPTVRINFDEDFHLPPNSVPDETSGTRTPIDVSATLFFIVIESREGLPEGMTKNFLDAVGKMADYHYDPKYLMASFAWKPSSNIEELLEYAWSIKILDLTIIELVQPEAPRRSILIERLPASPTLYHFNPLKNENTRERWTPHQSNLHPNKVQNFWGYPITYHTPAVVNSSQYHGYAMWKIIVEQLNCSERWINLFPNAEGIRDLRKVDIIVGFSPFSPARWDDTLVTTTVYSVGYQFLVPILMEEELQVATQFFVAAFLSFGIVLTVWIFMRLLGIKSYSWRAFNIARLVFGISVSQQPRRAVERIIFTSLLALFVIYSSDIYGAITEVTVHQMNQVKFDSLLDFANSKLTIYVFPFHLSKILQLYDGPLEVLRKRTIPDSYPKIRASQMASNNTYAYLLSQSTIDNFSRYLNENRSIVKRAGPVLWLQHCGFQLGKRTPYRSAIDKIIMRAHSSGLVDKIVLKNGTLHEINRHERIREQFENNGQLLEQLLTICAFGYSLSLLVFIIEIIYHRISMYKKSRKRLLPLFR